MPTSTVSPHIKKPKPNPIPGYLTTGQISALTGLSQEHVSHLIRDKKIEAIKVGTNWLITEESWTRYIATKDPRGAKPGQREDKTGP
ncbi:MAG: helix-turn-helix domain-containing protein [Anaerolineae bacterium]